MTQKAAVLGHPVGHSLSPKLHGFWIEEYGLDANYSAIDVTPGTFPDTINQLIQDGYKGVNITIPYKEEAFAIAQQLDENAQAVGAVNTLLFEGNTVKGFNTDVYGIIANVKAFTSSDFIANKNIMILGAGGAARACIYAMIKEKASTICLTNRTQEKAQNLQQEFSDLSKTPIEVIAWEDKEKHLQNVDLLINTTSLGMEGMPELEINIGALPTHAAVFDIVYSPLMTNLLLQAKEKELTTITGIGMLLYQAAPAFESWFGVKPQVTKTLEEYILAS